MSLILIRVNQLSAGRDLMVQTRHGGVGDDEEAGEREGGTTGAETESERAGEGGH